MQNRRPASRNEAGRRLSSDPVRAGTDPARSANHPGKAAGLKKLLSPSGPATGHADTSASSGRVERHATHQTDLRDVAGRVTPLDEHMVVLAGEAHAADQVHADVRVVPIDSFTTNEVQ